MTSLTRSRFVAAIDRASKVTSFLGGVATLAMTALITFDVLMRYFLGQPQLFVDELAGFLQIVIVFWGLASTFQSAGHIRVDLLINVFAGTVRAWLRVVTLALAIFFLAVVTWVTWETAVEAYHYDRVSTVMLYPLWLPMLLIPSGCLLMALAMLVTLVRQVSAVLGPAEGRNEVHPGEAGR